MWEEFWEEGCDVLIDAIADDEWASSSISAAPRSSNGHGLNELAPDRKLLEHPNLAVFLNQIIVSFNELRQCALRSSAQVVAGALEDLICSVVQALTERGAKGSFGGCDERFADFCAAFADSVIPFTERMFCAVYRLENAPFTRLERAKDEARRAWRGGALSSPDENE